MRSRFGEVELARRTTSSGARDWPLVVALLAALMGTVVVPVVRAGAAPAPPPATSPRVAAQAAPPAPAPAPLLLAPGLRRTELAHKVTVGQNVPLRAAVSSLPGLRDPRLAAEARAVLATARWALVRKPLASRAVLTAGRGTDTTVHVDVPGAYRVEMSFEWRRRTYSAAVTVTATELGPLVTLNTIDYDSSGRPGIVIGSQRYATPSGGDLQVLAINRQSLEMLGNKAFPATSSGLSSMDTFVKGFDATAMVVITNPAGTTSTGGFSPVANANVNALNTTLNRIGGAFPGNWNIGGSEEGCWSGWQQYCYATPGWSGPSFPSTLSSFSMAGVPGMQLGQAWRDTAVQRNQRDGRITGYLTEGSAADDPDGPNAYTIVRGADGAVIADTCVSGGPAACVIQVGGQQFAPPAGSNGVFVVQLDRTTLAPIRQGVVTSVADLQTALQTPVLNVSHPGHLFIPGVDDQRLFVLQSVGTGKLTGPSSAVLQSLDQLGATLEAFTAAVTQGTPYSVVGVADDLPWSGTGRESSSIIRSGQTGTQRVVLVRERDARFTPQVSDPAGKTNLELYDIVFQAATPWSYAGSPVLPYIAGLLALPSDIRSGYPNRGIDFGSKLALLVNLQCPSNSAQLGFTCTDFANVQAQLEIEFDGVQSVRGLLDSVKSPFQEAGQTQQFEVQDIASQIQASLQPPPTASSSWGWLSQFSTAMYISSYVATLAGQEEASTVFGLLGTVAGLGSTLMSSSGGNSADDITSQVNQLNTQLANQNLSQIETIGQIEIILVADQGKLLAVRNNVGTDPDWAWTQETTNNAITSLNAAARAETYTDLMPLSWPIWDIQPTSPGQTSPSSASTVCVGEGGDNDHFTYQPFLHAVAGNQFPAVTTWGSGGTTTQLWTFAHMSDVNSWWDNDPQHHTSLPSSSLTDQIFSTTGTGAYQYAPRWYRQTYNPPGRAVCVPSGQSNSFLKLPARSDVGPADTMAR